MYLIKSVLIIGVLGLLAGCGGSSGTAMDDDTFDTGGSADGGSGAQSSGVDGDGMQSGGAFDDGPRAGGILDNRVIYFGFNQSDIDADSREVLEAHGEYLSANAGATVRLEGHTDERGSREYNIGLGERRAQAVRQFLLLQGVASTQLSTVSYGEERPAVLGSDEEAWSLNRRVELVYTQ